MADRGRITHAAAISDIWPAIPPALPCPSGYPQHVEEALAGSGARIDRCSVAFKVAPRARFSRACLRSKPSVSAPRTDAGGGAAEGIRERIRNQETSRLSRRRATANFLRAVLLRA